MTTTISDGTSTLTPLMVDGYTSAQAAGNLGHAIIGTAARAVTLRPAGLRTGTLSLLCGHDITLAQQVQTMLTEASLLTFADTTNPSLNMTFMLQPGGQAELVLDDATRTVWSVQFAFEEVGT